LLASHERIFSVELVGWFC